MEGSQAVSPMGDNPGENISLPATPQRAPPYHSANHPPISLPSISSFGFFTEGQVPRFSRQTQSSPLSPLDVYPPRRQPARVSGKENLPIQNAHLAAQQVMDNSFGHGVISPPASFPGHVQTLAYSRAQPGYNTPTPARTQHHTLPLPIPQPFHTAAPPQSPSAAVFIPSPGPLVGQTPSSVNDESAPPIPSITPLPHRRGNASPFPLGYHMHITMAHLLLIVSHASALTFTLLLHFP